MKFGELKSIGHNLAASFASGIGLPIGLFATDVFGEVARSPEKSMTIDFLTGATEGALPSQNLNEAIDRYRGALESLCHRHGGNVFQFKALRVRFYVTAVFGGQYTVIVEDNDGRQSSDSFAGVTGRRLRRPRS